MDRANRCNQRQLISVVTILVLLIGGTGAWWWAEHRGHDLVATREAPPRSMSGAVEQTDGYWCAKEIVTACVSPDGAVYIPRGDAHDTLSAYAAIYEKMPNVESFDFVGFAFDAEVKHPTQEVSGHLSATEALDRMLEGSGLAVQKLAGGVAVFAKSGARLDINGSGSPVGAESGS